MRIRFVLPLFFLTALLSFAPLAAQGQQGAGSKPVRLGRIEWTGLERYSQEQANAATGLQVGQMVEPTMLDAAAQRLYEKGIFKKLSYRYRVSNNQAVVTFIVEEMKGGVPIVYDNFVWFTEEELRAAIRKEIPGFDGTAPEAGGATESIARALGALLRERKIEGEVEYMPEATASGANARHIFFIKGVRMPICTLSFTGASGIPESELVKKSKDLFKHDYSNEFVYSFARTNLFPLYRERGQVRAAFSRPLAKPFSGDDCKNGVAVTIPVTEGEVYSLGKVLWEGNDIISTPDLEPVLGMREGEVANGIKFDTGIAAVLKAYGKRGFIMAKVLPTPEFDDASKKVSYRITVKEGGLYRMGSLTVQGLPGDDQERIKMAWKLKPGDVYDNSYLKEFLGKPLRDLIDFSLSTRPRGTETSEKPRQQNQTVDVTLTFN